ncbi:MAG: hypothetical protein ABSH07_00185 [Candidatus Dormibacteria bacterium]
MVSALISGWASANASASVVLRFQSVAAVRKAALAEWPGAMSLRYV